jgi:hypothetical protein
LSEKQRNYNLAVSVTKLGEISLFWAIFTLAWAILTQLSSLKTWFVILILTFKSDLMQLFWTFNLRYDILATVLATLPNIGRFSIFWSLFSPSLLWVSLAPVL